MIVRIPPNLPVVVVFAMTLPKLFKGWIVLLTSKYRQRDVAKGIFFLFELVHTYARTYCEIPKKQFARVRRRVMN